MRYDYDLIIIGGGPAGATCALYASRLKLNTLLVDKATFPRDKICGDAISGKAVRYLKELGIEDEVIAQPNVRADSVYFSSPAGDGADIAFASGKGNGTAYGYVCRREVFDNILFQNAKSEVETREGFTVTDILQDGDRVCGITGRNADGEEISIRAKTVIAADGYNSILLRKLGLYLHEPKHWIVATRAYYTGITGLENSIEIHFVKDVLPGYFWIFPLENGLANVGLGMVHSELKKRKINLRKAHIKVTESETFAARFKDAELQGGISGWNLPVGSKWRPTYGHGYLIIGDAAGLIDPFSGEGIGNAMQSAKIAAEVCAEICEQAEAGKQAFAEFDSRLRAAVGRDLWVSTKLQRLGRFQPLLNLIIRRAQSQQEVRQWLSEVMDGTVDRAALKSPMTYLRLLFQS